MSQLSGAQQVAPSQSGVGSETQTAASPAKPDAAAMEQEVDDLQAQLDKLRASKDPAERRQLMRQYRHRMDDMMAKRHAGRRCMMIDEMPMREHMQEMQKHMQEMMKTENPEEMGGMMAEQHRRMHDMMEMMQCMHGGGQGMMMGAGAMRRHMDGMRGMHRHLNSREKRMIAAYRQMEKRLDMMQALLEQALLEQK